MANIFISYSSEDKTLVKKLAALLESKGWTVWWDRDIPIGEKYDTVIENELHKADCVIVVWTKRSVRSEWVKNEASEADQQNRLVPVVIEEVDLPLAFKRIESAMMIGWHGEPDHPELDMLYHAIETKVQRTKSNPIPIPVVKPKTASHSNPTKESDRPSSTAPRPFSTYAVIAGLGLLVSMGLLYYYLHLLPEKTSDKTSQQVFYIILILFGIACSALVFGLMNTYATLNGKMLDTKLKMTGPGVGVMLIVLGGLYLPPAPVEKIITIRLFDHHQKPVPQGEVKINLKEYIRSQSVDNMGQALFTGLPAEALNNPVKIQITSPGYTALTIDTLLTDMKPIEITLPLAEVVMISGKVKTAAEIPIDHVEVNVDGTKYAALSVTDGSYHLRLEEYTLGDEISITTSHDKYEDKTFSLKITSPNMNQDIFLNPVSH